LDQPELADLVEGHRATLHTYVSYRLDRSLRLKEPVSDIVQSAIREVLTNPGRFKFQGHEALRAFLIRAAENKIKNKRRHWDACKRSAAEEPFSDGHGLARTTPSPTEVLVHRESMGRLEAALAKLTEEDRTLFTMHRMGGLSSATIAEELGLAPSTVRLRIGSIATALARELVDGWKPERDAGEGHDPAVKDRDRVG